MDFLYPQEHALCFNDEKSDRPAIEDIWISNNESWNIFPIDNKIIFVLSGKLNFSFGEFTNKIIPENKMMVLPTGNNFESIALEDTHILLFRLRSKIEFCDRYSLSNLQRDVDTDRVFNSIGFLDIDERLRGYIDCISIYIKDGLRCYFFFLIKIKELFFLLRAYFPKRELYEFLYPLLSNDTSFSDLVFKNYQQTKTVQELANLMNYSLSGFQKKFKRVFGIPAYQWMNDQRSKSIFHEINKNQKSFKEISFEYGFSSPSHFNDFCKINFGDTPGKLRKKASISTISRKKA